MAPGAAPPTAAATGGTRVLVATAHPDDADIMAGGTLARWLDEGYAVHSVVFTRGERGHDDPTMTPEALGALREAEQREAAAMLGGLRLTFLDFPDGELAWAGRDLAEVATRLVRAERPDIVVTHDPFAGAPGYRVPQLHPDHRAVGLAVVEACYFRAPGLLYHPTQRTAGLAPHRVREVLLIMSDYADHVVDIGAVFERKVRAVRAHTSQFGSHEDLEGFLRRLAERAAAGSSAALGEAFKRLPVS